MAPTAMATAKSKIPASDHRTGTTRMKWFFWLCAVGAVYSYLLYPVLLMLVPRRKAADRAAGFTPRVTIVVACRNEEKRLRTKILNTLATTFPNREILVAS